MLIGLPRTGFQRSPTFLIRAGVFLIVNLAGVVAIFTPETTMILYYNWSIIIVYFFSHSSE